MPTSRSSAKCCPASSCSERKPRLSTDRNFQDGRRRIASPAGLSLVADGSPAPSPISLHTLDLRPRYSYKRAMPYRRRQERDRERARRAAAVERAKGQSALDVALTEIGAAFDQAAVVNGFKIRVERLIRRRAAPPSATGALRRTGRTASRPRPRRGDRHGRALVARRAQSLSDCQRARRRHPAVAGSFARHAARSSLDAFQANGGRYFEAIAALCNPPTAMAAE